MNQCNVLTYKWKVLAKFWSGNNILIQVKRRGWKIKIKQINRRSIYSMYGERSVRIVEMICTHGTASNELLELANYAVDINVSVLAAIAAATCLFWSNCIYTQNAIAWQKCSPGTRKQTKNRKTKRRHETFHTYIIRDIVIASETTTAIMAEMIPWQLKWHLLSVMENFNNFISLLQIKFLSRISNKRALLSFFVRPIFSSRSSVSLYSNLFWHKSPIFLTFLC